MKLEIQCRGKYHFPFGSSNRWNDSNGSYRVSELVVNIPGLLSESDVLSLQETIAKNRVKQAENFRKRKSRENLITEI